MYFKALSYLARTLIYLLTSCMCIEYNKALDTVAVILNFQSRTLSVAVFVHFKLFVFIPPCIARRHCHPCSDSSPSTGKRYPHRAKRHAATYRYHYRNFLLRDSFMVGPHRIVHPERRYKAAVFLHRSSSRADSPLHQPRQPIHHTPERRGAVDG